MSFCVNVTIKSLILNWREVDRNWMTAKGDKLRSQYWCLAWTWSSSSTRDNFRIVKMDCRSCESFLRDLAKARHLSTATTRQREQRHFFFIVPYVMRFSQYSQRRLKQSEHYSVILYLAEYRTRKRHDVSTSCCPSCYQSPAIRAREFIISRNTQF